MVLDQKDDVTRTFLKHKKKSYDKQTYMVQKLKLGHSIFRRLLTYWTTEKHKHSVIEQA